MSNQATTSFASEFRVYIEDTDAGGIVYYVNYLKFMERARTEMLRDLGFQKAAMFDDDAMFVVTGVNVNYRRSAELDDLLRVESSIVKLKRVSAIVQQAVYCDEECLVSGEITIACVQRSSRKPVAISTPMYQAMSNVLASPATE